MGKIAVRVRGASPRVLLAYGLAWVPAGLLGAVLSGEWAFWGWATVGEATLFGGWAYLRLPRD